MWNSEKEEVEMNTRKAYWMKVASVAIIWAALFMTGALAQQGKISINDDIAVYTPPKYDYQSAVDFENARAMPLPQLNIRPAGLFEASAFAQYEGLPEFEHGRPGDGKMVRGLSVAPAASEDDFVSAEDEGIVPQEYGTALHPFTTMRVDTKLNNQSKYYPYSAAGKLYFKDGSSSYVCSASLIKRGLAVTAAHCVADFGKNKLYTQFQYVPAQYSTTRPYGTWSVQKVYLKNSYLNGTDPCYPQAKGVVCQNDVAVIVMKPQNNVYPGAKTGWLGYGYDGYGFTSKNLALINQLGYPVSHDAGLIMQRTDSLGYIDKELAGNTVWGSRQTGGSSGGPELVNLGILPKLSGGITVGKEGVPNTVIGVTSWGYSDQTVKQQGASPFLSTNVKAFVNAACAAYAAACK
jgi:V8-like Glu-specific endopeptidase